MMSTDIVNEIAQLLRTRVTGLNAPKDAKPLKAHSSRETPKDEVELSHTAEQYASKAGGTSEFDKEQFMKVERLKAMMNAGMYKVDHQMVETIAERIANTLV